MLDFSCISTDGFVEVNNFGVRKGKGSEKLKDVFRVLLQFVSAMGEGAENGGSGGVPSDGPIPVGLERSKSPSEVEILSSTTVEKSPEKTASRLTADPERTCFHSDLGNGGSEPADWRDQSACLRSAV